ncbi:YgjV family protein [Tenacibaculum sp. 190524A02b]
MAVVSGLYAVSKKKMLSFRIWHIVSCVCYIIYGIFSKAYPIFVSGLLFICIHIYQLIKLTKTEMQKDIANRKDFECK